MPHFKNGAKKNRDSIFREATMGFEPMMRVLQTLALPLGHVAWGIRLTDRIVQDAIRNVNLWR